MSTTLLKTQEGTHNSVHGHLLLTLAHKQNLFVYHKKPNNHRNAKKTLSALVSKADCVNDRVLLIGQSMLKVLTVEQYRLVL